MSKAKEIIQNLIVMKNCRQKINDFATEKDVKKLLPQHLQNMTEVMHLIN
ncbi:MAG: hypothetical protein WKF59_21005 [Chitinophagaceae bacterium]